MLAVPLSVKVNQGTSNAPVTFSVTSGSALLTLTSDTTTTPAAASVTVRSTSIYTGTSGTPTTVAQAYIWLPAASGNCSTIQISATSGTKSVTLATTASAIDPVISAPSNVTATPTSPTTAEITWIPADENQNTTLQVSEDGGATWKTVAVVQAGIAAVTLTGLTPDQTIKLRALTGGNNPSAATSYDINNAIAGNSGGETSNSNGDADLTPLSKIIVTGRTAHVGGLMPGYPGFCDGRSRYLVSQVDWEYNYDCNYESFIPSWPLPGWPFPASGRHGEFNRETGEFDPLLCWTYGDGPIAGGYVVCNTIDNQTKIGDGACDYIGIEYKKYSEVMWNEYLIDDYVDDVEKWVGRIVFKGSFIDGVNYAGIARNLDDPEGEFYDQDGAYYSVTKLQYQFKVNKDLNGSVSYVKLFFEDSGAISASIGKIATNGETIVPSTALEIDPLNDELNPSKENGTWCILPVEIKKMWETNNKANQIWNPTKKDDPINGEAPNSVGETDGAPRNKLFVVPDPADGQYKVSLDVDVPQSMRSKFIAAAYVGETKVADSDTPFSDDPNESVDIEFTHSGASGDIADFSIRIGYDADGSGTLDPGEQVKLEVFTSSEKKTKGEITVRGTSSTKYTASKNKIDDIVNGSWTTPGWATTLILPHAKRFLQIFRDGNASGVPVDKAPSSPPSTISFNAFSGYFSEWLTHNSGASFNDDGVANISEYAWNSTTDTAEMVVSSKQIQDSLTSFYYSSVNPTVGAYFANKPVGTTAYFPSSTSFYDVTHAHESPAWVPATTVAFHNLPSVDPLTKLDDVNGTIGRGRLLSHKVRYKVEKKEFNISVEGETITITGVVPTEVITEGVVTDLYDFCHMVGGAAQDAAILQIGFGNGDYGPDRNRGIIYQDRIEFNKIIVLPEETIPNP